LIEIKRGKNVYKFRKNKNKEKSELDVLMWSDSQTVWFWKFGLMVEKFWLLKFAVCAIFITKMLKADYFKIKNNLWTDLKNGIV